MREYAVIADVVACGGYRVAIGVHQFEDIAAGVALVEVFPLHRCVPWLRHFDCLRGFVHIEGERSIDRSEVLVLKCRLAHGAIEYRLTCASIRSPDCKGCGDIRSRRVVVTRRTC